LISFETDTISSFGPTKGDKKILLGVLQSLSVALGCCEASTELPVTEVTPAAIGLRHPVWSAGIARHCQAIWKELVMVEGEQVLYLTDLSTWITVLAFVMYATVW